LKSLAVSPSAAALETAFLKGATHTFSSYTDVAPSASSAGSHAIWSSDDVLAPAVSKAHHTSCGVSSSSTAGRPSIPIVMVTGRE
jgi:hypothetical protein